MKTVSSKTKDWSLTKDTVPSKPVHPKNASPNLNPVKNLTPHEQWWVYITLRASPLTATIWLMDLALASVTIKWPLWLSNGLAPHNVAVDGHGPAGRLMQWIKEKIYAQLRSNMCIITVYQHHLRCWRWATNCQAPAFGKLVGTLWWCISYYMASYSVAVNGHGLPDRFWAYLNWIVVKRCGKIQRRR
jgi:hypothetical protein